MTPAQFISRVRGCLSRIPGTSEFRYMGLVSAYDLSPSKQKDCDEVARRVGEILLDRQPDECDCEALDTQLEGREPAFQSPPKPSWREWVRHAFKGCGSFIEEDGEVINGLWWGWCAYCGCRHSKNVEGDLPVGPWTPR